MHLKTKIVGLYIPFNIDTESQLVELSDRFFNWISSTSFDLKDKELCICYPTRDWHIKYGLFNELLVLDWVYDLSNHVRNFWTELPCNSNLNWISMYNYIVANHGLAIFFNRDHIELESYISSGYDNYLIISNHE